MISDEVLAVVKRQYQEDGFALLGALFTEADLQSLADAYDETVQALFAEHTNWRPLEECRDLLWAKDPPSPLGDHVVLQRLLRIGAFLGGELLGVPEDHVVVGARVFHKPARGCGIPWHQDRAYIAGPVIDRLNIWIPLDAVGPENGCLRFIPGSHERGLRRHDLYQSEPETFCIPNLGSNDGVAVPLGAGDASVHGWEVVHCSTPNLSDLPRRSLVVASHAEKK